jgi:hypothetical protein
MKRYELKIAIIDDIYIDQLVVALVRQGYAPYYNKDEKVVCFEVQEDELTKIKEER